MSSLAELERRRAQNRENLRAHYGIQRTATGTPLSPLSESGRGTGLHDVVKSGSGSRPGSGGAGKGKGRDLAGDPLDLDSAAFSPQQYYANLVTTSSLPQLIMQSTTLSNDVKDLHSSRHGLVYNHHHQLFAAGDTISILNTKTSQLQEIVSTLQESFDDISKLVEKVKVEGKVMGKKEGEAGVESRKQVEDIGGE